MERVQDGHGIFELVVDGVLLAVERIQGGDPDPVAELLVSRLEPLLVGDNGAAGDEV